PVGEAFLVPTVTLSREASTATVPQFQPGQNLRLTGLGWTLGGSLGVDLPVGRRISLTPEAGVVGGRVSSDAFVYPAGRNPGPSPTAFFADPVSGWWVALELSATF